MTNPPQPPPQPTQPSRFGVTFWTRGPGVILVVIAAGLMLLGIFAATEGLKPGKANASDLDVTMTSCSITGSTAKVGLSVTNRGDRTRSVSIGIEYRDSSGARLDTDTARIWSIAPGDTARTDETTLLDAGAPSGRCVITSIR